VEYPYNVSLPFVENDVISMPSNCVKHGAIVFLMKAFIFLPLSRLAGNLTDGQSFEEQKQC